MIRKELDHTSPDLNLFNDGFVVFLTLKINLRDFSLSVFNCYVTPGQLSHHELDFYVDQLEGKVILCGDFNARHSDWNSGDSNTAGNIVHSLILNSNGLTLFTPKDLGTRMDSYRNTESTIDLCIGSSEIFPDVSIVKKPITGMSDHIPLVCNINKKPVWNAIKFRGKWKIDNKFWPNWLVLLQTMNLALSDNINHCIDEFTSKLKSVAGQVFKHSSGIYSTRYSAPWWTEECSLARAMKRKAKWILKRHFSTDNLQNYKREVARCKRVIKKTKKNYWKDYCTQLSIDTPINRVWKVFNSIRGRQPPEIFPLAADALLTAIDKANRMAGFFERQFEAPVRRPDEDALLTEVLEAISFQHHAYNIPFKEHELELILKELPKGKASGIDNVPYEFALHLDGKFSKYLLDIVNMCWRESTFPVSWKHGLIMPFLKPGKDATLESSYRPLILLSNLSKIFEKLILRRLVWFLESNLLLPDYQSGFRQNRSTLDQLIRMEHIICKSIKEKKVVVTVLFDISKAYDRVPHTLLLVKLARMGVKGRMLGLIKSFLEDRTFQVSLLGELSGVKKVDCGIPQGAILSPILFVVFLADMPEFRDVKVAAFADDLCFYTVSDDYHYALAQMQRALDSFKEWCDAWRIKINTDKTHVQYFTRKRLVAPPLLNFGNMILQYEKVCRYLGLYFDSPYLTWSDHIKFLVENCNKRLNILRAASSTTWGGDRQTLFNIYRAFILSKLTYGCEAFGSASKTLLSKLEVVQNSALRIISGALRSTPIVALQCEVYIPPLLVVIEKFNVKFFLRTKYMSNNHAVKTKVAEDLNNVENLRWSHFAYKVPAVLRALHSRLKWNMPDVRDMIIDAVSPIPPWLHFKPEIRSDYGVVNIKNLPINVSSCLVTLNMESNYQNFVHIFTDGSRAIVNGEWRSGAAVVVEDRDVSLGYRLRGYNSILVAELFGILKALEWINNFIVGNTLRQFVIFTDSMAALMSLENSVSRKNQLVYDCWRILRTLYDGGYCVIFQWVPSHIGISGNERADGVARDSLQLNYVERFRPLFSDMSKLLSQKVTISQIDRWETDRRSVKLGEVKENWEYWPWTNCHQRRIEVAMARLRLGHCCLNSHLHKIGVSDTPNCLYCGVEETIDHFLRTCPRYYSHRVILHSDMNCLGIMNVTNEVLLGGGNFDKDKKIKINKAVIKFLRACNRKL